MVALNRIYTRVGDDGGTQLASGERRPKYDLRIETYGTVDELNAVLGLCRLHVEAGGDYDLILGRIQNDLFDLGADLATPPSDTPPKVEQLRVLDSQVHRLESEIDRLNADLSPLRSFVLPGGTAAAAHLHLGRTVCRRAERLAVALAGKSAERISPVVVRFLNRLSDLLFVMARHGNDKGRLDVLWKPGENR